MTIRAGESDDPRRSAVVQSMSCGICWSQTASCSHSFPMWPILSAYNITTVADILDQNKSEFHWMDEERTVGSIYEIIRYECLPKAMSGLSIFRLVEMCSCAYVTRVFVDRVRQNDLQGFHFIKLWPLAEGVSWQEEDRKERQNETRVPSKGRSSSKVIKETPWLFALSSPGRSQASSKSKGWQTSWTKSTPLPTEPTAKANTPHVGSLEGQDVIGSVL